jgi:hypothetical protein
MSGMRPTAKELLQRREEERRLDAFREALTSLRGQQVRTDDEVLAEWSRQELEAIGRSGSTPDASLEADAEPSRLRTWLAELEARAALGDRIFLGTSLQFLPWLECEVTGPGWLAEAWERAGGTLRAISGDRSRLLVIFDEEHAIEGFIRAGAASGD